MIGRPSFTGDDEQKVRDFLLKETLWSDSVIDWATRTARLTGSWHDGDGYFVIVCESGTWKVYGF